ncbi:DUF1499 domain-containing protein [Stappia stellulata]|uniref:DUF1499 domain-containing protein n=1 Tax=Stappia stellulata TaxID=71235 RepID=UPI001CD48B5B|nr:DUF1499 domain-containing protein [Stappia stellulata]MCA1244378.1 DUF1499 domain-containing protein [Stappia stellulata]
MTVHQPGLSARTMHKKIPVRRSRLAAASLWSGRIAVPVLVIGALLHRLELVSTPQFLVVLTLGFLLGALAAAAAVLALVSLWTRGGTGWARALRGLLYGLIALLPVFAGLYGFWRYPLLADVSTDIEAPPVLPPAGPGIPERSFDTGELQQAAYPDIVSRRFRVAPADLHAAARRVAEQSGWIITAELPPGMPDEPTRFQAEAVSLLFAFRDDVSVRILPDPVGSRLDIRSASRFAEHDLGANARRIRGFLEDLDAVLLAAFGAVEAIDDDEDVPELPPLDPNAPREEDDGPPPLPSTKPEDGGDPALSATDGPATGGEAGGIAPLPDDISEIYQDDPAPGAAQQ